MYVSVCERERRQKVKGVCLPDVTARLCVGVLLLLLFGVVFVFSAVVALIIKVCIFCLGAEIFINKRKQPCLPRPTGLILICLLL